MNKFDTNELMNCFKMTVDLEGIRKLEEYIKNLEQENNQLKENLKLEKQISNGIAKDYEILLNQKKELRSWLENKLASDNYTDGAYYGFKSCLLKLNKLEGGNND